MIFSSNDPQLIQNVVIAITFIGGLYLYTRNRIPERNVKNLTMLTNTYEKRIVALEDELKSNHQLQLENVKAIADLQGQVKVYKELPLRELADGIAEVVTISKQNAASNDAILKQLQKSAGEEDGNEIHITTEVHKEIKPHIKPTE